MKKSDKKVVKASAKGKVEEIQGTLFSYKSTEAKDSEKTSYRLFTKGRPFTIKI